MNNIPEHICYLSSQFVCCFFSFYLFEIIKWTRNEWKSIAKHSVNLPRHIYSKSGKQEKIKFSSKYRSKCSIKKAQQKPFLATAAFVFNFLSKCFNFQYCLLEIEEGWVTSDYQFSFKGRAMLLEVGYD